MSNRKSISKKRRFDVFKRDSFQCQYCGNVPPKVVLEVDHFHAVALGGTDDTDNLITSCFDCNRGKGAGEMSIAPQTIVKKAEALKEHEAQIAEYNKILKAKKDREDVAIDDIENIFSYSYKGYCFNESFRRSIRVNFLPELTQEQLEMAMTKACARCHEKEKTIKYFCGICWNLVRGVEF